MIECFPASTFYGATEMANKRIKELAFNYKPIEFRTCIDGEEGDPSYNVIILFEKTDKL